jgi:hypothetical protein
LFNNARVVSFPRPEVVPVITQTFFADAALDEEAPLNIPNIMLRSDLTFILDDFVATLPRFFTAGMKAVHIVAKTIARTTAEILNIVMQQDVAVDVDVQLLSNESVSLFSDHPTYLISLSGCCYPVIFHSERASREQQVRGETASRAAERVQCTRTVQYSLVEQ